MRTPRASPLPCSTPLLTILLLLLLFDVTAVEGFEPLIQLPRSEDDDDGGVLRSRKVVSVDDFGAVGDGVADDTKAFKDAWATACSLPTRKTVIKVPEGNTYLVRPTDFVGPCCSNVTLRILGTIVAPKDPAAWCKLNPHKWLYFHGIRRLTVRGRGTINGMGEKWWAQSCKINRTNPCRPAPRALTFHRCKHLKIHNLTMVNSQQTHVSITNCFHVKVLRLNVVAPAESPNTDGIHISGSVSVRIRGSDIQTGDDCISIVSGSSDVRISNIKCGPGHGISIGSLGKSNSWSQVSDVQVNGVTLSNTENGLRIKTWQGGQGYARNIAFHNVTMKNVSNPIIIDQYYCDSFVPCLNQTPAVRVSKVTFNNITGTSATENVMIFACSDCFPCQNIFLKDIQLSLESGGNATAYCWNASGFSLGLIDPPSCLAGNVYPIEQRFNSSTALWYTAK